MLQNFAHRPFLILSNTIERKNIFNLKNYSWNTDDKYIRYHLFIFTTGVFKTFFVINVKNKINLLHIRCKF